MEVSGCAEHQGKSPSDGKFQTPNSKFERNLRRNACSRWSARLPAHSSLPCRHCRLVDERGGQRGPVPSAARPATASSAVTLCPQKCEMRAFLSTGSFWAFLAPASLAFGLCDLGHHT